MWKLVVTMIDIQMLSVSEGILDIITSNIFFVEFCGSPVSRSAWITIISGLNASLLKKDQTWCGYHLWSHSHTGNNQRKNTQWGLPWQADALYWHHLNLLSWQRDLIWRLPLWLCTGSYWLIDLLEWLAQILLHGQDGTRWSWLVSSSSISLLPETPWI